MAQRKPKRPATSAVKAVWVEYLVKAYDIDRAEARRYTKAQIITACDEAALALAAEEKAAQDEAKYGDVERAVRAELAELRLDGSALAAAARKLARLCDEADTVAEAVVAARELRLTLGPAKSQLLNGGAPTKPDASDDEDDDVVVGPNRLQQLRERTSERPRSRR